MNEKAKNHIEIRRMGNENYIEERRFEMMREINRIANIASKMKANDPDLQMDLERIVDSAMSAMRQYLLIEQQRYHNIGAESVLKVLDKYGE